MHGRSRTGQPSAQCGVGGGSVGRALSLGRRPGRLRHHRARVPRAPLEVLRKELERWWLLNKEEVTRVATLRELHDRTRGEGLTERDNARVERIIDSGGDA